MRIKHIRQRLRDLGAKQCHEQAVLRSWSRSMALGTKIVPSEGSLPLKIRHELPAMMSEIRGLARLHSEHKSKDGSSRMLVELADGQMVESVMMLRDCLCVSTQVGCAVGCQFCMTGRNGLLRQLGSAEIVAQVALARSKHVVKKVVFMGMGEPAHNMDNVLEAIELLGTDGAIGSKSLVFSTVGDKRVFEQLPLGVVQPALALSLHTSRADLRAKLLPNAPRIEPAELVELGEIYARTTGFPIQYQWTLLEGINDTDEELKGIERLLSGKYAIMNFIPYNAIDDLEFKRTSWERSAEMSRYLYQCGILTKLRYSAGQDINGGCGQLRARSNAIASTHRVSAIKFASTHPLTFSDSA